MIRRISAMLGFLCIGAFLGGIGTFIQFKSIMIAECPTLAGEETRAFMENHGIYHSIVNGTRLNELKLGIEKTPSMYEKTWMVCPTYTQIPRKGEQ